MNKTKPKTKFSRLLSFLLSKLPWAAKPSPPAPVPAAPPWPRLGKKILIIDDDAVILHILSHKLRARGYDIETAVDPQEALAAVRAGKPDLILLDLVFPPDVSFSGAADLDGFGLMRWLHACGLGRQIPIFIISTEDPDQCKGRWPAKRPEIFFQKPIDHDRLLLSIRRTLWKDGNAVESEAAEPEGVGSTSRPWRVVAPQSTPFSGTTAPRPARPPTMKDVLLTIKMAEEPNPPPLQQQNTPVTSSAQESRPWLPWRSGT
jgi:CheY-like chemotaxis protein